MADDTVTLPGTGADVAVDRIAGDDYQLVKLVDATEDSLTRTGVDAHPLVAEARLAFVDFDDSIVPVTDNADNHWLPVALRGTPAVSVNAFNATAAVTGSPSATDLTGPSNGTWGTDLNTDGLPGTLRLAVKSTGGTPTVAVFGASAISGSGGTYDQQLPLVVPDGDSLVLSETFTPGVGARFCFILGHAPYMEIRATSGGTGTAVDATLVAEPFPTPIVATVRSSAQPVTDNGGSLTVDGTVAATQSGTWNVGTLSTVTNVVHVDDNSSTLSVDDGGGSLTVDGSGTFTVGGVAATDAAVSGNPLLAGARASTAAPTAMSTDGDAVPLWTDRRGALHTVPGAAGSRTITGVASSASSTSILASNTSRRGVLIHNNSSAPLYLKYGATASIASGGYSVKIPADGYWEMPKPIDQGALDGIWSAANGYANVTELT